VGASHRVSFGATPNNARLNLLRYVRQLFATPKGQARSDPACIAGDISCNLATRSGFDLYECIDYSIQLIVDYTTLGASPVSDALNVTIAPTGV
jgi:hypothetical protein